MGILTAEVVSAKNKTVAVIGLGYVGLPLAMRAGRAFSVVGFDIHEQTIDALKDGTSHIEGVDLDEVRLAFDREFTSDESRLADADVMIICVPTPVNKDLVPDLRPLESAVHVAGRMMKKDCLLIIESTINPGVCEGTIVPILEGYEKTVNKDYYLAHCPERINPGDVKWHVGNINRVVGGSSPEATEQAAQFYESFIDADIKRMKSIKETEAVKIVENSFRDINIAFVNELARSFDVLGIDVINVIDGAATKPFAFMAHYPGVGVGGHCIPVDPYYLIDYAKKQGFTHTFLKAARQINRSMPEYTASVTASQLAKRMPLSGARVLVLGLSYKANLADYRESPSFELINELIEKGCMSM